MKYSPENLRQLMAESPAYQNLSPAEKAIIADHLAKNNRPILIYIYHQLYQEASIHQLCRQQLAKKILQISPSDQQKLTHDLKSLITIVR